jgi:hypothetical protein
MSHNKGNKKKREIKKKDKDDNSNLNPHCPAFLKIENNSAETLQVRGHKGYETLIFKDSVGIGLHYSAIKILKPQSMLINGNFYGTPAIRFGLVNCLFCKKLNKIFSLGSNEGTYAIRSTDQKLVATDQRWSTSPTQTQTQPHTPEPFKTGDIISMVLKISQFKNPILLEN